MVFLFGAPGGNRTPNNGSEDRCDIRFTTGARCNCETFITYKIYHFLGLKSMSWGGKLPPCKAKTIKF
jgi:hypothetical protein